MSTSVLMSIGTRAMFAAYAQLHTTGNNIANANSPGYSRQQTILTASEGQHTGSGFFGRGVTVQTVTRATDIFLTQQAAATRALAAADAARRDLLAQLDQVFGRGDAGFGATATQLFNAFSDLAASPADLSARQAVFGRAEDLAALARSNSEQLDMLQANVHNDVENGVSVVNTLAASVAEINGRISTAIGSGHTPNDLLDARDELISQLSEYVEVHTIGASDGSTSVFIAGGQTLVLGTQANRLIAARDPADLSRSALEIEVAGNRTSLSSAALGGGRLYGQLAFQNDDLVEARTRLDELVTGLADAVNEQQSFGLDLDGAAGSPLFGFNASASAAAGISVALGHPRGIAAASPLVAAASSANTGTASVGSLVIASIPVVAPLTLSFTNGTGDYEILDATSTVVAAGTWSTGTPIAYNGFELSLLGRPNAGDAFSIAPTPGPQLRSNNGNALVFDMLADRPLIAGQTVSDAYAALLTEVGTRAQGAMLSADSSSSTAARIEEVLAGKVGVNLDEEAARLIQYQQAYQAAAKMLQAAQTVLDTVLDLGR